MQKTLPVVFTVFALQLLPLASIAQAKHLRTVEETRKAAEAVVASVAAGNATGAWKELRPLTVIPPAEFEVFEAQFGSQMGTMLQRFGPANGYEFVREELAGKSVIRYTFLVKHEKAPMRWLFVFYQAPKGWVVTDFKFDGNASAFFPSGG
jgi:hypothetical protein